MFTFKNGWTRTGFLVPAVLLVLVQEVCLPAAEPGLLTMISMQDGELYHQALSGQVPQEVIFSRFFEEVYGDIGKKGVNTLRVRGRYVDSLGYRDPAMHTAPVEMGFADNGRMYMINEPGANVNRSGFDGSTAWKIRGGKLERVPVKSVLEPFWTLNFSIMGDIPAWLRDSEVEASPDPDFYAVRVRWENGKDDILYFDRKSGLLRKLDSTIIESYREVDGMLLPERFWFNRKGGWTRLYIDSFEVNVELPDSMFTPPPGY